jgi:tRNA-dihydrouridine synthase 1
MLNNVKNKYRNENFKLKEDYSKMTPFEFWKEIGSPKYVCAPMVDQSECAFRILTRRYSTDLTYTPMIHSVLFNIDKTYQEKWLADIFNEDQPTFVQFCGHDPEMLLKAAKLVEDKCPAIDLNLGCPQAIAKRGNYGAYLLDDTDLVLKIIGYLTNNLKCGVSCKIRLFPDLNKTVDLCKKLEELGIKVLTVHGRTKKEKKQFTGECNWEAIRIIKENINIPLIANGGIEKFEDIERCFLKTKCDAVMSSEKLLEQPFLFTGNEYNLDDIALEYLDIAKELNTDITFVRSHLFKFYYAICQQNKEIINKLGTTRNIDDYIKIGKDIKELRKDVDNKDKYGWYNRYRKDGLPIKSSIEKEELDNKFCSVVETYSTDISNFFS